MNCGGNENEGREGGRRSARNESGQRGEGITERVGSQLRIV